MKIDFIEMSGFRGFRDKLRIECANGFTVISGRNGVGKSTVCDAVEFTITGEIRKYRVEKSDKDSLSDYVWWRGSGDVEECYTKIGLISEDGQQFEVLRSREDGLLTPIDSLTDLLCAPAGRPELPLEQLCKTSIIRDEWIAAQSLDLKETERFDFVSSALGEVGSNDHILKARKVIKLTDDEVTTADKSYERVRENLARALTDLSEERSNARQTGNVSSAISNISKYIVDLPEDLTSAITVSHSYLKDARKKISALHEADSDMRLINEESNLVNSDEYQAKKSLVFKKFEQLKSELLNIDQRLLDAKRVLEVEEISSKLSSALSKIIEGGEALGLHEGKCPLCSAKRSQEEFDEGIDIARDRAGELGERVTNARKNFENIQNDRKELEGNIEKTEVELSKILNREKILQDREAQLIANFAEHNLKFDAIPGLDEISTVLRTIRNNLIEVERSIATLESSKSITRISRLEATIIELRKEADASSLELEKRKKAASLAREFEHAVKRTSAEIIDERLAAISPLLKELYQRLRPHSEWKSIDYSIRGDVRRFLSLKVGDKLNPQFVFSSGQRRVAGIAFLFAVNLARPWCLLNSLILDDPVQHIDDYRAIHLVELLSSLRRDGQQIICTIEDSSLAALLTRRLSGAPSSHGRRYDLSRNKIGRATASPTDIIPFPRSVMQSIS